jgi:methylphosphotriester-DNA--protein-cysteine methyltransferase
MHFHSELGPPSFKVSKLLLSLIQNEQILLAGNKKLKIYGLLTCSSGKRMKRENRVFFKSENEAMKNGFRPCGHCMKATYLKWKELQ